MNFSSRTRRTGISILIIASKKRFQELMADSNPSSDNPSSQAVNKGAELPEATRLANLRSIAQQHLEEIDAMGRKEHVSEEKRVKDLEREAKRRDANLLSRRRSSGSEEEGEEEVKKEKLRTAQGKSHSRFQPCPLDSCPCCFKLGPRY